MDMMVYILPVFLFIITLIIILALRAEDKKNRSLRKVNEHTTAFRNESTQTLKRIQETCHDSLERVDAKEKEARGVINDLQRSLDNLSSHRRDLLSLESICKNYEVALEKLRLQTEHAENRISVIQNEVRKAESINVVITSFKNDAAIIEESMFKKQEEFKALIEASRDSLDSISQEHKEQHKRMVGEFQDELTKSRDELNLFVGDIKQGFELKKNEVNSFVDDSFTRLSDKESLIHSSIDSRLNAIEEKKESLDISFNEKLNELERRQAETDDAFNKKALDIKESSDSTLLSIENGRSNLSLFYQELVDSLNKEFKALCDKLDESKNEIDDKIRLMVQRKDEILVESSNAEEKLTALYNEKLSALSLESERVISALEEDAKKQISLIISQGDETDAFVKKAKDEAIKTHQEKLEEIKREENEFVSFCERELNDTFNKELNRIDSIYQAMSTAAVETIDNLIKRQSEIKESVTLLNQGCDNTIANTVDRLNNLQKKLNISQAALNDTQKNVTDTKEKLFDLKQDERRLSDELESLRVSVNNEKNRLEESKRDRLIIEAEREKLKAPPVKKRSVTISPVDELVLFGDEENILDED